MKSSRSLWPVNARWFIGRLMLVLGSALATAGPVAAETPTEDELKAALLYKISGFVTWPDDAFRDGGKATFTVCGIGEDPLGGALQMLRQRRAADRTIRIRNLADDEIDPGQCQMLFVGRMVTTEKVLASIGNQPVLTVSDAARFAATGGMIEIYRDQNRFGFRINRNAALASGLQIAAPLLELSTLVAGDDS